jgi:hypothetical protein
MAAQPEIIEGESTDLTVVEPQAIAHWTPRFAISVNEAVEQVEMKREFMKRVMRRDEHYGVIPGTPKPTLLKPGAELLLSSMGLHPEYEDSAPPVEDVTGADHGGEPFILYRRDCLIYRQTGPHSDDRMLVAKASGICSSWEEKYRYRDSSLNCPNCGKGTVIKGKEEYGGGWICFKKKGGCGAKFANADPKITAQSVGKVANPNISDLLNTILKMADKRALVAATLLATGCSDLFTQDMEDRDDHPPAADDYYSPPGEERPTDDGGAAASTQRRTPVVTTGLAGLPNHNAASSSSVPPPTPKARATNPIVIKREAPAVIEGSAVEVEPTPVAKPVAIRNTAVAYAEELARASLKVSGRSEHVIKKAQDDLDRAAQATFKRNFGGLYDDEVETLLHRLEVALKQKGRDLPEPN